ncbi:hypothetical protein DC20_20415 [Rufibacter tibetensis]|uniref:Uncharacterized protein n=1 Tax=Rufibacter tibetensis TaxID=512763 RepID=A0A0N7HX32_9BACT|nr:hypothetical protein DC20_20415 [Rufibacter tibetensis]
MVRNFCRAAGKQPNDVFVGRKLRILPRLYCRLQKERKVRLGLGCKQIGPKKAWLDPTIGLKGIYSLGMASADRNRWSSRQRRGTI